MGHQSGGRHRQPEHRGSPHPDPPPVPWTDQFLRFPRPPLPPPLHAPHAMARSVITKKTETRRRPPAGPLRRVPLPGQEPFSWPSAPLFRSLRQESRRLDDLDLYNEPVFEGEDLNDFG